MTKSPGSYASPSFDFSTDEEFARRLDASDPLASFRDRFHFPRDAQDNELIYLCGNSLGLMPKAARDDVIGELDDWAAHAVAGHFQARHPWYPYHRSLLEPMAAIVGARPDEVAIMNGLTVNLHLMMASFYRPTADRFKILVEDRTFPSDLYAVRTQARWHGYDPDEAVVIVKSGDGEDRVRNDDIEAAIDEHDDSIALVFLSAVQYFTGQWFDMPRITAAAKRRGCRVGWQLAHAAGNVPMRLHDWEVDFAVWCTYKYLNAGPGAVAGCFVHERHGKNPSLPRLAGWWGDDPHTRFQMHLKNEFIPHAGADGWQVSNPPILSMAPLRASLALFAEAGMQELREKSVFLSGYLQSWLNRLPPERFGVITPSRPEQRGCQLSLRVRDGARPFFESLRNHGVVIDFREPDVIRIAPAPLFNRFHEVWRLGRIMEREAGG
jgi:kynureninase